MRLFALHVFLLTVFAVAAAGQTQQVALEGLDGVVTVQRDQRSIPYIEAANDRDLYFVQGYVTASDRLWQMDLLRRVARGETAEIFGRSTLDEDKRWRRLGFARISEEALKFIDPELRAALDNYARGVNAYIASLDDASLPVEFKILQYKPRPWTAADTIVIGKILAEALSSTYSGDLMREAAKGIDPAKWADLNQKVTPYDVILFGSDKRAAAAGTPSLASSEVREHGFDTAIALMEEDAEIRERSLRRVGLFAEGLAASNNWVISGKRTADGKAILANDPHLLPSAPGIWYLTHLSTPTMRVAGVTFPGVPGIVLGHNDHIAWGATNVGPDVQDLYLETFNGKGEYKTPDGWRPAAVRKEEIRFRASPLSPQLSTETIDVVETRHGPIILDSTERKYALRWTAFDPKNSDFNAFYSLNRAKDWSGFKKALSDYGGATQNFVYADTSGNIGWYAAGKIPIRRTGDGALPYDGSTNAGDWTGFIPFAELPNLYNPPSGFIVTANQRIVGTDYKYQQLVRDFAAPWRARRLYDLLLQDTKATIASSIAAQHDVYNIPLKMLAEDVVRLKAASPFHLQTIANWDGRMTPDSEAALIVNEIRMCAAQKLAMDNPNVPANAIRERILHWAVRENSARWRPSGIESYASLLRGCSDQIPAAFTSRYGADAKNWVWGKTSFARFPHPLAVAPLIGGQFITPRTPIAGSGQTPNVGSYVSMRHVTSPGNWDTTHFTIPLGQSGDPKSQHYKDQFDMWNTGQGGEFPFTKSAVQKAAKTVIRFAKP